MKHTTKLVITALVIWIFSCIPSTAQEEFTYNGDTGPGFWSDLEKDFSACAPSPVGHQSPIDIDAVIEDPGLGPLNLILNKMPFTLINNGHTIMATPKYGGTLTIDRDVFTLSQFHFHTLSEHTVEGKRGVMELHAVFIDSQNNYAVIGVLYKIGKPNRFLEKLITAGLPKLTTLAPVTIDSLGLDDAFTDTSRYYTYPGSLTTPPCSETVTWLVLQQWADLSLEQFEAFRTILGDDFRPLQKRNQRVVRATTRRGSYDAEQSSNQ
jgi:carbonic anhydrase